MNSESILKKVKSCNSCKRELPEYFFGVLRSSKDGYNPKCKDCRCTQKRRKKSPHKNEELEIYHLNKHNKAFLKQLCLSLNNESLALSLKDLELWFFSIKNESNKRIAIFKGPQDQRLTIESLGEDDYFVEVLIHTFALLNLRLFHLNDHISLSNWKGSPHKIYR